MLRRSLSLFVLLLLGAPLLVQAQAPECSSSKYQQQTICPGQSGAALLQCLQAYRPADSQMLDYRDARDQMYGGIDNQGGSVTGVYSGFTITGVPQDPAVEPRTDAFNKGINTEHTWPQSLGIGGDDPGARSNMHHLFPTRIQVNSARGNLPLLERDDDTETDDWYRNAQELSSKPSSNLDSYSERDVNNGFEPRELHEGNAARALFYIWTVYGDLVGSQSSFFEAMKDDLRTWHEIDPPDQAEFARTCAIAEVQDDKVNPFVIDPTLVDRAFFGEPGQEGDVQITAVERSAFIPDADAPLTITATISSTLPLAQVEVRYMVDGTDQPPVAMTSSGGEAFAGTIPASAYADGSRVRYRVYAEDDTGVSDMSNETVFFAGTTLIAQLTQTDAQGRLLFDGDPARISGIVQAEAGVFGADEAYLEDTRGLRLTGTTALTDRERHYVVEGTMQQDDGQAELDVQSVVSIGDIQPTPPPEVTLAALLDDAEAFEGRLVRVVDVQQVDGAFPASGDGSVVIDDGSGPFPLFIDGDTGIMPDDQPAVPFDVVGIVSQEDASVPYDSGYRLMPRGADDLFPPPPTRFRFVDAAATVAEGDEVYTLSVQIDNPGAEAAAVEVVVKEGTAEVGADVALPASLLLTVPAGVTAAQRLAIEPLDDEAVEDDETLTFVLRNPTGGVAAEVGPDSLFTLTITDDDQPVDAPNAWINELHYANAGPDENEFVEIALPEGYAERDRLALILLDGATGGAYATLSGGDAAIGGSQNGAALAVFSVESEGLQDGDPDGLALCFDTDGDGTAETLVASGTTPQFLSYGGAFTATEGCAAGQASLDIGVTESDATAASASLGLAGTGSEYDSFGWAAFDAHTRGAPNADQTLPIDAPEVVTPEPPTLTGAPNPFRTGTTLRYRLSEAGPVTLTLYDALGRVVRVLVDDVQAPGQHTVMVDASGLPSGIYYGRLVTAQATVLRTLVRLR